MDGGLELLQASGFELVFDDSSLEAQPAAAPSSQSPKNSSADSAADAAVPSSDAQAHPEVSRKAAPSIVTAKSTDHGL